MQVKFKRRLEEFDYILSFDLAKHKTGFSLVDFKNKQVPYSGMIITEPTQEMVWQDFYVQLEAQVERVKKDFGSSFFVLKERLPNQAGARSTIATLQGLAQTHAIFDLFIQQKNLDYYDWNGVHSISVKSYFKQITENEKPQKEDIYKAILNEYTWAVPENNALSYDISDSIAVAHTLVGKKWNADINEEIKSLKKELKSAKAQKKIDKLNDEIQFLMSLKEGE